MLNAISVDLEDWYHICGIDNIDYNKWSKYTTDLEGNVKKVLALLHKHNVCATFFVVGIIAEKKPDTS